MPLSKKLLERTANKIRKKRAEDEPEEKEEELTLPEIRDIGDDLQVADMGETLGRMKTEETADDQEEQVEELKKIKEEFETGQKAEDTEGENIPHAVDFSAIRAGKKVQPTEVKISVQDYAKMKQKIESIEKESKMKNIPLKAHKIPTQYLKKMGVAWKPPEFTEVNQIYSLVKPFAFANLFWDKNESRLSYYILEPHLTKEQQRTLQMIKEIVVDLLDVNLFEIKSTTSVRDILKEKVDKVIRDYGMAVTEHEYQKILYYMYRDFLGLGIIEGLMHDPNIEDISCDGVKIPLYIYHRKYASIPSNLMFHNEETLNKFIIRMAQRCGKHISVAEPLLDGALPDGSRLQATFSSHKDIAMQGSTFTIRKFTKDPLTITDLLNFGTLPEMIGAYLWVAMEYRKSILYAGGTATGKTSFLNAMSMFLPAEMKIISIEDTPEVRLPHEHWLQKVVRTGFGRADLTGRKSGEISMYDLLRAALRERPDEIIVGEVRGKEAYVLFQGMATGHAGMATIHGDSVDAVMHRLQTPPINLSAGLLQHLNIIIILTKARIKGIEVRRIKEVVEVLGLTKEQEPIINTLFRWNPATDTFEFSSDKSYVFQRIIEDKGIEEKDIWEEVQRRRQILKWMKENNIRYYIDVGKIIQKYYSAPEEVLKNI
ncbi:type II/IV secretion system ATPase subunit [archaeon]